MMRPSTRATNSTVSGPSTSSTSCSRVGGGDDDDNCGTSRANASTSSSSTTAASPICSAGDAEVFGCSLTRRRYRDVADVTGHAGRLNFVGTEHVRWLAEPTLTRPVMVAAFTGWNDAGDAASTALRTMVEAWGADALAEIDPEAFTDFATVRPHVRLDEDHHRSIVWPTVGVWSVSLPGTDVILVLGPEPALRWRVFCEQLEGIAEQLGATMAISLGALLADVPHSRPVPVIGTATDDGLIERFELRRSQYEGPTGIVGVLHDALHRNGLSTASLWAAVPGYASQVPSPKAAMALIEQACAMIGTPAPLGDLAHDAL